MNIVDFIIAAENGDLDDDAIIEGLQAMIDDGTVWKLQGSWGRAAVACIRNGDCSDTHNVLS